VTPPPAPKLPIAFAAIKAAPRRADVSSIGLPGVQRGCAWDYAGADQVEFEVWASNDLRTWRLATNTVEKIALFEQKPMEFYAVRSIINGIHSDWAKVGQ
jgi:hypothetical protein